MYNGEVGNFVIIVPDGRSSNSKRTCPYRPDLVAARASGAPMTSRPVVSTAANQSINQSINQLFNISDGDGGEMQDV